MLLIDAIVHLEAGERLRAGWDNLHSIVGTFEEVYCSR